MESNKNNGQGNRIINFIKKTFTIELLTFIMIIVTGVNVYESKQMAETTKNAYLAENRPYLAFDGVDAKIVNDTNAENADLRLSLKLDNLGKSILNFRVTDLKITIDDGKKLISPRANSDGGSGALCPGQSTDYKCEVLSGVDMTKVVKGTLEYNMVYESKGISSTYNTYRKATIIIYTNGESEVQTDEVDEN